MVVRKLNSPTLLSTVENGPNELVHQAKDISKNFLKVPPGFFLLMNM